MKRGISVHFAVPDPGQDCSTQVELQESVRSANIMVEIARARGFSVREPLVGARVTSSVVGAVLKGAACELEAGDTLLITYAGHGDREARPHPRTGVRGFHESWCLPEGRLWDYDLYRLWPAFRPGVRIILVSESCYSETVGSDLIPMDVGRMMADDAERLPAIAEKWEIAPDCVRWIEPNRPDEPEIGASVVVLAASRVDKVAQDGLFTQKLQEVWEHGNTSGYCQFIEQIGRKVYDAGSPQEPSISVAGAPNPAFLREAPFTIQ